MEICVTDEEYGLMAEILQERHAALLREISRTDHFEFKQMLKKRNALLERLLEKLGVAEEARPSR
jgi:hypothetical protein